MTDLDRRLPALLAAWRGHDDATGPLTPSEVREVAEGIVRLSTGLTRDRALIGKSYMDDRALLGAYLLFYWPVSYLQMRSVLSELPPLSGPVLDLGAGPGPMAFAALDAGADRAVAVDRSTRALAMAERLAESTEAPLTTKSWNPQERIWPLGVPGKFSTITAGHVLNELPTDAMRLTVAREALAHLVPGGSLVVVEPALRETSRGLHAVRDALVAAGFAIRAPCFFRGPCPALVKSSDWCHAERDVAVPPLVATLADAAGLNKDRLKFSYLVVAAPGEAWPAPPSAHPLRVVSEALSVKGRRRYMVCGPEGRDGLALLDRHRSTENELFYDLDRGDAIDAEPSERRGDGGVLGRDSRVTLLARAGKPW